MKITKEEYAYFSDLLAQKFEWNKNKKFNVTIDELKIILGQPLVIKTKSKEIQKFKFKDLQENQIVFLVKTKKDAVRKLAKHFRNCASHIGRITKSKIEDSFIYLFEDKYDNKVTMRCKLSKDTIELLINKIYDEKEND